MKRASRVQLSILLETRQTPNLVTFSMQNHVFVANSLLLIQANNWEKFLMVCAWGNGRVLWSAVGMVCIWLLWCFLQPHPDSCCSTKERNLEELHGCSWSHIHPINFSWLVEFLYPEHWEHRAFWNKTSCSLCQISSCLYRWFLNWNCQ